LLAQFEKHRADALRSGSTAKLDASRQQALVERAARVLGFRREQVRVLPVDDSFRLAPHTLAAALTATPQRVAASRRLNDSAPSDSTSRSVPTGRGLDGSPRYHRCKVSKRMAAQCLRGRAALARVGRAGSFFECLAGSRLGFCDGLSGGFDIAGIWRLRYDGKRVG
jgi:hypothetical protein